MRVGILNPTMSASDVGSLEDTSTIPRYCTVLGQGLHFSVPTSVNNAVTSLDSISKSPGYFLNGGPIRKATLLCKRSHAWLPMTDLIYNRSPTYRSCEAYQYKYEFDAETGAYGTMSYTSPRTNFRFSQKLRT